MPTYFDQAATTWDDNPVRVALMRDVAEAIFRQVQLASDMELLDYGCGTGLISFFLAPHVAAVTAVDSSEGMLAVLREKIDQTGTRNIRAMRLDLEQDAVPDARFDLIVVNMVMHHVADSERMLRNFHAMLRPAGVLCVSDLDTEPGVFHDSEAAATVHHHGFDRQGFRGMMERSGFHDVRETTAHTIRKPVAESGERDFPVFLMTGRR
ncbi:MAG: methyltransferase domain-containing protein [Pirellulaceae bacterium]|nr:methyltransferase domain-containing protein [Pirellulaceae bacterium]